MGVVVCGINPLFERGGRLALRSREYSGSVEVGWF